MPLVTEGPGRDTYKFSLDAYQYYRWLFGTHRFLSILMLATLSMSPCHMEIRQQFQPSLPTHNELQDPRGDAQTVQGGVVCRRYPS